MSTSRLLIILTCALVCAGIDAQEPASTQTTKPMSAGVYVDRDGAKHRWHVNQAHTLIWDGKPYLPVGGMYCPPYTWEQNESGWTLTKGQLDMLKRKGVIDLYIHFAMSCPPESLQRMIDYLEEQGFRYGIELTDGPGSGPGYSVQKDGLRVEHITTSGTYGVEVGDPLGGIFLLVHEKTGKALKIGSARVYEREVPTGKTLDSGKPEMAKKKGLEADVECAPGRSLCLYFTPLVKGGQPYFWDGGFEAYREKLLAHFGKVKFGKGFRFVVDPLHNEMNVDHTFIPTSPDSARQFSRRLTARYLEIAKLNRSWAITEAGPIPSFDAAARLVPLRVVRCGLAGMPAQAGVLYDPQDGKTYYSDAAKSQAWYDMTDFSGETYARYCNAVCEAFKQKIADVPIIFKHAGPIAKHRINPDAAGFDGIGMEPYGVGETLVPMNAAVCYSEAEQSAKTMWLVVTEFSEAAFENQCEDIAHPDRESMYADFATLLGAGAKGIFVFGLSFGPWPTGQFWMSEYLRDPRQLEWMSAFRRIMESSETLPDYRPTYYYRFPAQRTERSAFGPKERDFAGIDGDWTGFPDRSGHSLPRCNGSLSRGIMRAPDGTWVLPTWDLSVETPLVIANLSDSPASLRWGPALEETIKKGAPFVTYCGFRRDLGSIPSLDKYFTPEFARDSDGKNVQVLRPTRTSEVLAKTKDGKVWNLVDGSLQIISKEVEDKEGWQPEGLRIPSVEQVHEPERFMVEVLGVQEFRLEPDIRGFAFQDGGKMVTYLWAEQMVSSIRLDPEVARKAKVYYANGEKAGERAKDGSITLRIPLRRPTEIVETEASYVKGKHHATEDWPEALVVEGISPDRIAAREDFRPVYSPPDVSPGVWLEAEAFTDSNFNLGKFSGMTKLSGGAFWGLDTFVDPAPGTGYYVQYTFKASKAGAFDLWVREWVEKSGCKWRVNGGKWNDAPQSLEDFDRKFCGPWALFDDGKIIFAWHLYGQARLKPGANTLELRVTSPRSVGASPRSQGDKYSKFLDALAFTSPGTKPWELAENP